MRLCIVRHGPLPQGSGLAGRRDLSAHFPDPQALAALRNRLGRENITAVWSSPAKRCRETCAALGYAPDLVHPDLWEQSFGAWEGLAPEKIPDLGPLSTGELASHAPPEGESFLQMAARVRPVLESACGTTLIVAHAGTARAALAMVVGPAALSFSVAPLSLSILDGEAGIWSIGTFNWTG